MEFFQLKCPNCDADLKDVNGVDHYYCPFCNTNLLIDSMDDGILKARAVKTEHDFKMFKERHDAIEREREFQRTEKAKDTEHKRFMRGALIYALILIGLLSCFPIMGIIENSQEAQKIAAPISAGDFKKLMHNEAEDILYTAGFESIDSIKLSKKSGLTHKPGQVESISIDGNKNFKAGTRFNKNVTIIITYYNESG